MATTDLNFDGSLDRFSFYKRDGKTIVRGKGGPTNDQIKNKASCQAIRDSNVEFGGASTVCALIRRAIGKMCTQYSDMGMASRLTGKLKLLIAAGKGKRGTRTLDLAACPEMIAGFEFNESCFFEHRFKKEITITFSEDRNTAVLQTSFRPATDVEAPAGATSFQLVYTFMRMPAYGKHATMKQYVPLHDGELVSEQVSTDFFYIDFPMRVKLTLPLTLPASSTEGTSLLCIVGIGFYQGKVLMSKEVCGMKVVKVG